MPSTVRTIVTAMVTAVMVSIAMSSCQWRGVNSLHLPGTAGHGDGSYTVRAEMPDVINIEPNSRVRVDDVTVGNVTRIELQGMHALVTMRLNGDVHLPANSTAKVGQTSLLGSMHVELAPPVGQPAQGELQDGSLIPLSAASSYPSTEQTLASVSMLLNGGGLGYLQEINQSLTKALAGRESDMRGLLTQLDTFIAQANAQTHDILAATDSLNALVKQFAERKGVIDAALTTLPQALAVLNEQRRTLADAIDALGQLSALTASTVNEAGDALVTNLRNLGPVLDSLANAGPALTRSLGTLSTFPWPKDLLANWWRGDYANVTVVLDLTLSRLDTGLFTGTRWEGSLTALEMQWGRTIGMQPSPATAGNPLTFAYHQGGY